mgnify:CR=1 FL=1
MLYNITGEGNGVVETEGFLGGEFFAAGLGDMVNLFLGISACLCEQNFCSINIKRRNSRTNKKRLFEPLFVL